MESPGTKYVEKKEEKKIEKKTGRKKDWAKKAP